MDEKKGKVLGIILLVAMIGATGFVVLNSYAPATNVYGLPDYALSTPAIQKAYTGAVEMKDEFMYLPCNCGCGMGSMEHGEREIPQMYSLKDCFIKADGSGFESHAAMDCGGCITQANAAIDMLKSGTPLNAVRSYMDKTYGSAMSTQTPMPPEGL